MMRWPNKYKTERPNLTRRLNIVLLWFLPDISKQNLTAVIQTSYCNSYKIYQGGPTKVKARKSFLFTEGSLKVEKKQAMKNL